MVHHLRVADAFLFLRFVSSDRELLIATGGFDCLLRTRTPIIWARCSWPVDAVFCRLKIYLSHAACPAQVFLCGRVCVCSSPSVVQTSREPVEATGMFSRRGASDGLAARACVDAVVAGQGSEIFTSSADRQLQMLDGRCLGIVAEKLSAVECQEGQGGWSISQDGQVRQGNMCLAVAGSRVAAADCDDAAGGGGDKFFQVAVPAHDPTAVVAVKEVGALLRASVQRQRG